LAHDGAAASQHASSQISVTLTYGLTTKLFDKERQNLVRWRGEGAYWQGVSSVAREGRQGRTAPGGNQKGAAKMVVKF